MSETGDDKVNDWLDIYSEIKKEIDFHKKLIDEFESTGMPVIIKIVDLLCEVLKNGGCIYICGNGGSAADAQHIAGEFVVRFKHNRVALPAVALTTNCSILTSIGNDYSFEEIFSKQVEALVRRNDILWVLSTSGSSKNVISAVKLARKKGANVISFVGMKGSELENLSDISLTVCSNVTASVQEIHEFAYHIICGLVEKKFL